jgi:pimeloyl-ACP methyl ester carboxylesterase
VIAIRGGDMSRRALLLVSATLVCLLSPIAVCQSALSANSGINSADTYVVVDLTVTSSTTINLPDAFYNPANGTTSNVLTVTPATQTFHVESGYDSSGGLVMNVWPTGTAVNPSTTDAEAIGFIRFGGGQITVFSQSGAPMSLTLPANVPTTWPLSFLGSNPGPSAISNLVVPNIQNYASALKAYLVTSQNPTVDYVTVTQPNGSTAAWTYGPSGSNWIAQQLVLTPTLSSGSGSRTIKFANLSWYDNATKDSARAAKGYTVKAPPNATTSNPNGITVTSPASGPTDVYHLGGTQNIAFMHGFHSDSSTWTRMSNWLNQDFRFGTEIIPTFTWSDHLSTQGSDLVNEINSVGGSNYILIGHSQGGLISRSATQQYQTANPSQVVVKGVVTLDSPNEGAPIAYTGGPTILAGLEFLGAYLWGVTGCNTPYDNFVCWMAAVIFFGGPVVGDVWYSTNPDIQDLLPGSTFLNQLNSYAETFKRTAVVSYAPLRWDEMRILDNALFLGTLGCYPETGCGERDVAAITGAVYDEVVALFIFCIFEEIFDPYNADYWAAEALYFLEIGIGMDLADGFWNLIVSGLASSDGLVPTSSQNYPSTSATQYSIYGADSHTGATTSTYVHATLDTVLQQQFQVPTQASCSFTASPSSFSISPSGGTSSFSLSTGAGCQWSAVSQAPWLSITSGTSGTSSGTVSFSVAVNPSTLPRTSAIQAGSGLSSAIFNVTQVGVCTYSLSEGPIVAIPPAGETNTVTVTTQTGCVWSAVSNASWLTITSGVSGTGTGSFTYTAAPNSGSSDLSGTITVMSQTLTVIAGSPVGTPGTGTVTIYGSSQSIEVNECPTNPYGTCWVNIPDGGSVSVTIGTETFSTGYSTTTAAQIASALAGLMNYTLSPIYATVSGTTISIRSTLNGAATNYSLSTSYTYNSTYFSSPAFTAAASGTQLTGGTD